MPGSRPYYKNEAEAIRVDRLRRRIGSTSGMGYYADRLSGARLRECYEIAPPRVRRYLAAEIRFVQERLNPDDVVLELGCGYGRVALQLEKAAERVVGIDTSAGSLTLARETAPSGSRCEFVEMDAVDLRFSDGEFDAVVCVQNGICAFGVDPSRLLDEALRVTRPGGKVLFSSYSDRFWEHRLHWFELQAERGLVGEIDYKATGDGFIVCKDGFRAGAMSAEGFESLCARVGIVPTITVVDDSSVFCEIDV
jgi:2-polyprenyl-6-hydroxyphenyl methylase/3-demethylubiquinone-9 3-methyltransferase